MEITSFCEGLLDALELFDQKIAPLGLYASDDLPGGAKWQEWHRCLKPHLQQKGCGVSGLSSDGESQLNVPKIGVACLKLIKISKIKVRKYGSHYRLDKYKNYSERWESLRIDKDLSELWKLSALADSQVKLRLLLFIGFDKDSNAFASELHQLRQQLTWDEHGALYFTRTWPDRYERGFGVRLSLWARPAPKPDEVNNLSNEDRVL